MAISCALVMKVPEGSNTFRYIYALVTYIIFTLAYTAICIPQNVLLTSITDEPKERLEVNMFGTLGTTIGQFAVSAFALGMIAALGNGSEADGYFRTILIFASAGALSILVCFKNTHERITPPENIKVTIKDILTSMNNKPWIICAVSSLCIIAAVVVRATSTVYYAQYVLKDVTVASKLLSIASLIGVPITLLTPIIATKFGKRNLVMFGCTAATIGSAALYFVSDNIALVIALTVIIAIGMTLPVGVIYVMTAEAIDYGEWKTGVRIQGFLMAFVGFGVKIANSVATMMTSHILDKGGYVGGAATQTESAIAAIQTNYLLIPIILFVAIILANCFYDLDKKYSTIREELMERRRVEVQ